MNTKTTTAAADAAAKRVWVVVTEAGTDDERIICDFEDFKQACSLAKKVSGDVVKKTANGSLTTEF